MKQLVLLALGLFSLVSGIIAQSNKEDIDLIQSAFGKDKKTLVSAYMQVPAKDSVAFWKLYDEYEDKRKQLGKDRINILQQYADQYDSLTDAQAGKLAQASISNDMQYSKLYETYFKKFSTVTGAKNAAKLFQLETYLQTIIRLAIMEHIPFVGQLDKQKTEAAMHQQ
jgi:hypothetical protein